MKGGVIWFSVDRIDRFVFALGVNEFVGRGPDKSAEVLAWKCRRRRAHSLGARRRMFGSPLAVCARKCENTESLTKSSEISAFNKPSRQVRQCCPLVVLVR